MPAERKRFDEETGKALSCVVRIPPKLAEFLYRETLDRRYRDETELVNNIVRLWAETLDPMDWPDVLKRLKAEGGAAEESGGTKAG